MMLSLSVVPHASSSLHRKALHSHFANELEGRDHVIGEMCLAL